MRKTLKWALVCTAAAGLTAYGCDLTDEDCDGGQCLEVGTGGDDYDSGATGGSGGEGGEGGGSEGGSAVGAGNEGGGNEGGGGGGGGGGGDVGGGGGGDEPIEDCDTTCEAVADCLTDGDVCEGLTDDDHNDVMALCAEACDEGAFDVPLAADLTICDEVIAEAVTDNDDLTTVCEEGFGGGDDACQVEDGTPGVCMDVDSCDGLATAGLCPGAANIQCCTPTCESDGVEGLCMHVDSCGTENTVAGLCPGSADIQCCLDE